jgi:hypothetical protein
MEPKMRRKFCSCDSVKISNNAVQFDPKFIHSNTLSANKLNKDTFFLLWRKSQISKNIAIVGGIAYYYYLTKKPKGSIFVFYLLFFIFVFVRAVFFLIYL